MARSNCFSINQLVGQNIILKKRIENSVKREFSAIVLNLKNNSFRVSSSDNHNAGFVIVHYLVYTKNTYAPKNVLYIILYYGLFLRPRMYLLRLITS